ncbi:MAG: hypothetical protein J7501_06180 [Bdellovibrio sp.]|nr:hypothetical protein [Bdellovibrio sp.]
MLKANLLKVLGLSVAMMSTTAHAISLDWTGGYRAEWTEVDRPSLTSPTERKAYGLNYLYLSPKIIAADGINIVSRFDILNSNIYPNSQVGTIWGLNANDNAATAGNQGVADIKASQLYLNVNQEFGSLIVGRAPFDFGLGMMYSAGKGEFDHWYTTRDMIAYKVVVGDWFVMPLIGREYAADYGQGQNMTVMGAQLQYENTEQKSLIGVYMQARKGSSGSLNYSASQIDAYTGTTGGTGGTATSDLSIQSTSFVLGRGWDSFGFKIEAGFQSGNTGIVTTAGDDVKLDGYGIAAELYFPRNESKWDWVVKTGMATGYNGTSSSFSGFAFNKNYNVGMLMFNHRLGSEDFFNTNAVKPQHFDPADPTKDTLNVGNSVDDESVGNAFYLAPQVTYAWNDKFDVRNTLVYAQLMNTLHNSVDAKKDLGLEWDIEVIYKPLERVQWVNQIGLLFPGEAWKNGNANLGNDFTFGFASKAAISF